MDKTRQFYQKYQNVYEKIYAIAERDSYVIGQEIDEQTNMLLYVIRLGEVLVWQYAVDVTIIPVITPTPSVSITVTTTQINTGQ